MAKTAGVKALNIDGFLIDDENEEKFATHGLSSDQVVQVLENEYIVVRNRRNRRASHMVVGKDNGGACITIPIQATYDLALWRPVTAWLSKDNERSRLEN